MQPGISAVRDSLGHKNPSFLPRGELFIGSDFLDKYYPQQQGQYIEQLKCAATDLGLSLVGVDLNKDRSLFSLSQKTFTKLDNLFITGFINGPVSCLMEEQGFRNAMLSMRSNPALFAGVAERFLKSAEKKIQMAIENSFSAVALADDIAGNNGLLFSHRFFIDMVLPVYRDFASIVHREGLFAFIHSDGNMRTVISLLAESGYDCLHPVDTQARLTLKELDRDFGRHISFMGHIDILAWNADRIRHEIRLAEEEFRHGGLILGSTGGIPADTPEEKLLAFYPGWKLRGTTL